MLRLTALTLLLLVMTVTIGHAQPQEEEKISAPGQYSGYTFPDYKSWTSTSQYVAMRDGVRLAVDVYTPAEGPEREGFPAILILTPYHRASVTDTGEVHPANFEPEKRPEDSQLRLGTSSWPTLGTGASFGFAQRLLAGRAEDGNDLINWIVAQPWSGSLARSGLLQASRSPLRRQWEPA
jgi:predicted acyl esterase